MDIRVVMMLASSVLVQSQLLTPSGIQTPMMKANVNAGFVVPKPTIIDCPTTISHPLDTDTKCILQCQSNRDCIDSMLCCPTKCNGRACRMPERKQQGRSMNTKNFKCSLIIDSEKMYCHKVPMPDEDVQEEIEEDATDTKDHLSDLTLKHQLANLNKRLQHLESNLLNN